MLRTDGTDGGPAFPQTEWCYRRGDGEGMSLRDWFAGQALTAAMDMNPHLPGDPADPRVFPGAAELAERRAKWAYLHADAMLAAREAGQ